MTMEKGKYWTEVSNKKKLFERVAEYLGFDVLHAEGWKDNYDKALNLPCGLACECRKQGSV